MPTSVDGLRADRDALIDILTFLTDAEWATPTACPGWTAKDLVAHLATLFHLVVDPNTLPSVEGLPTERAVDVYVATRAEWPPELVLDDYITTSALACNTLDWMLTQDEVTVPLGDLGTYWLPIIPSSLAFDHYTHIRADLLAPRGSITAPAPPSDELRLRPTLTWIAAALPQQNADVVAALPGPVELRLSGPAGGSLGVDADGVLPDAPDEPVATVACSTHDLVLWTTGRATWEELGVGADGDPDALAMLRTIHVF